MPALAPVLSPPAAEVPGLPTGAAGVVLDTALVEEFALGVGAVLLVAVVLAGAGTEDLVSALVDGVFGNVRVDEVAGRMPATGGAMRNSLEVMT